MFVLATNIGVYYFDAPYQVSSKIINVSSYIPFLLLLIIFPVIFYGLKIVKEREWNLISKLIFGTNTSIYIVLLIMFAYWELFILF